MTAAGTSPKGESPGGTSFDLRSPLWGVGGGDAEGSVRGKEATPADQQAPLTLAHAADFYRRYPGEEVTFYTRLEAHGPLSGFTLRIGIPEGLTLSTYRPLRDYPGPLPTVEIGAGLNFLVWRVQGEIKAGTVFEYQAQAKITLTLQDLIRHWKVPGGGGGAVNGARSGFRNDLASEAYTLLSQAAASWETEPGERRRVEETILVTVSTKGAYLKYLPAIYRQDELMGRLLMLFESFLAPVEERLDNLPYYFDPAMAPPDLLPWLAAWLDLALDERWAEDKRRRLIQSAVDLYRRRGTKASLQTYLEIYTGERPQIIEYSANNFRLGKEARLGRSIALGTNNQPHTFKVVLRLPAIAAADEAEAARQEMERRQMIERIIEAEKPAHTAYSLEIETYVKRET